jgi:hypothetical protein
VSQDWPALGHMTISPTQMGEEGFYNWKTGTERGGGVAGNRGQSLQHLSTTVMKSPGKLNAVLTAGKRGCGDIAYQTVLFLEH